MAHRFAWFAPHFRRKWGWYFSTVLLLLVLISSRGINWQSIGAYLADNTAPTTGKTTTRHETIPVPAPPAKNKQASALPAIVPIATTDTVTKTETAYRQPIWVTLAQPLLAVLAGFIALWQYMDKKRQEREHFDRKEQEDRFKDIQDRFASADARTRANAALRLAEMARLPKPGAENKPVNANNNPFFLRAVSPLAIALHMEENSSVRAANVEALADIAAFIKRKEKDDVLLHAMIAKLYDANITAKRAFIKALAEYCNLQPNGTPNDALLTTVAPFTTNPTATTEVLTSLRETNDFKADCAIHEKTHGLTPEEFAKESNLLLARVKLDADRLINTRDALANALCTLSFLTRVNNSPAEFWIRFQRKIPLLLDSAFLAGAQLNDAQLNRAQLNRAQLNDAQLNGAIVEGYAVFGPANFTNTNWQNADFTNSKGNKDTRLWAWLVEHYGTPEEKAAFAAEQAAPTEITVP